MAHPHIVLEILNRSDVSKDESVSDHWINGAPPGGWTREISSYPDVLKVDSLAEVGDGCLYRINYRNPPIIYLYRKLGIPIQFPLRVQSGSIRWEVAARRSEFQSVLQYAERADPSFQVVSIRRRPLRTHLPVLTDSQHQLLTQAMATRVLRRPPRDHAHGPRAPPQPQQVGGLRGDRDHREEAARDRDATHAVLRLSAKVSFHRASWRLRRSRAPPLQLCSEGAGDLRPAGQTYRYLSIAIRINAYSFG